MQASFIHHFVGFAAGALHLYIKRNVSFFPFPLLFRAKIYIRTLGHNKNTVQRFIHTLSLRSYSNHYCYLHSTILKNWHAHVLLIVDNKSESMFWFHVLLMPQYAQACYSYPDDMENNTLS